MKIAACRIVQSRFAASAFSGEGARRVGGRWSSPGASVVYAAGSTSLAMLEILVHVHSRKLLGSFVHFDLNFESKLIESVDSRRLPRDWRTSPAPESLREFGDQWATHGNSPVLRVPSVIVPHEWNYLINPEHSEFRNIIIGPRRPLKFDTRLIEP